MFAIHKDKLNQMGIMSKGQSDMGTWKLQFAQYKFSDCAFLPPRPERKPFHRRFALSMSGSPSNTPEHTCRMGLP